MRPMSGTSCAVVPCSTAPAVSSDHGAQVAPLAPVWAQPRPSSAPQSRDSASLQATAQELWDLSSDCQLARNARQRLLTMQKLKADEEGLRRKAQHLDEVRASSKASNDAVARKAAEHNQRFEEMQRQRQRDVAESDASRRMLVSQRRIEKSNALAAKANSRDQSILTAMQVRNQIQQATEERIRSHLEQCEEIARRKEHNLATEQENLRLANEERERRVMMHGAEVASQNQERQRRVQAADAARRALVQQRKEQQRQSLAAAGAARDASLHLAQEARSGMHEAMVERIKRKQDENEERRRRAARHLEDSASRARMRNLAKEQRTQRAKYYEDLVEVVRRKQEPTNPAYVMVSDSSSSFSGAPRH